ncbi:unnamed protein product, partial [Rotaria sp. Silwood1]
MGTCSTIRKWWFLYDNILISSDRLSKPKFNKRLEREIALAKQMTTIEETVSTPRLPPKPTSVQ